MLELKNISPDEFERWMRTESRPHGSRFNHDPRGSVIKSLAEALYNPAR